MPATGLCTNTLTNLTASQTLIRVPADALSLIRDTLDEPAHLFASLYTLRYSEEIMIYDTQVEGGVTYLLVQRGVAGTDARSWPDGACLRVTQVVEGRPCGDPDEGTGEGTELLRSLLEMLTVTNGLELILTGPDAPVLRIANTGVRPGDYGGADVNATGQFTHIPEGWPASAVPAFDACCDPTPPEPAPSGAVNSVEGIGPDLLGDVRLCAGTASDAPVTASTPVFICSGGSITKTTAGRIAALADSGTPPDLTGLVRNVGGLTPGPAGAINFVNAALLGELENMTFLVNTPDGVRRVTLQTLLTYIPTGSGGVTLGFDPATGILDVNGGAQNLDIVATPQLQIIGQQITYTQGGHTATATLPESSVPSYTLTFENGALSLSIGGGDPATVALPDFTQIPILSAPPAGQNYKFVRNAAGEYGWVADS